MTITDQIIKLPNRVVNLACLRMQQELVNAAQTGNLQFIKNAYIEDQSVIHTCDSQNCSLLHWAAIVFFYLLTCRITIYISSSFFWKTEYMQTW
jgi:hypothetical protein